jgi:hypothetical protein
LYAIATACQPTDLPSATVAWNTARQTSRFQTTSPRKESCAAPVSLNDDPNALIWRPCRAFSGALKATLGSSMIKRPFER